jgi:hypothetical protein
MVTTNRTKWWKLALLIDISRYQQVGWSNLWRGDWIYELFGWEVLLFWWRRKKNKLGEERIVELNSFKLTNRNFYQQFHMNCWHVKLLMKFLFIFLFFILLLFSLKITDEKYSIAIYIGNYRRKISHRYLYW